MLFVLKLFVFCTFLISSSHASEKFLLEEKDQISEPNLVLSLHHHNLGIIEEEKGNDHLATYHYQKSENYNPEDSSSFHLIEKIKSPQHRQRDNEESALSKFILSIDGGGIRGLIPAMILDSMEKDISKNFSCEGFDYNVSITDFFDVVAGTSTGSIISLGLLVPDEFDRYRPKYKAQELVHLYSEKGKEIFPQDWWREIRSYIKRKYSANALEGLLKAYFQSCTISQAVLGKGVFVPAYDITNNQVFFFTHQGKTKDYEMWRVARASSAAPTYFPSMNIEGIEFVDGGVFMNNPTLGVYARTKKDFPDTKQLFILSLGTGEDQKKLSENLIESGKLGWANSCPPVMMKGSEQATESIMDLFAETESNTLTYHRLQGILSEAVLDKVDEQAIGGLKKSAQEILKSDKFQGVFKDLYNLTVEKAKILGEKINSIGATDKMDLSHHNISGIFLRDLNEVLKFSKITHLNLTRCRINAQSLAKICDALGTNTTLTNLNLSQNGIGFAGVAYLGDLLEKNSMIQMLSLQENGIDKRARGEIGSLVKRRNTTQPTSLTFLDLSTNKIGRGGLEAVLASFKDLESSSLMTINLESNEIGEGYRSGYINLTRERAVEAKKQWDLEDLGNYLSRFSKKFSQIIFPLKDNHFPQEIEEVFRSTHQFKFKEDSL
jgi:patatin-like phospholipase/acyl hydrolase